MAERFDLLGDPVPANWGGRGRPPHIATTENRNKVILLMAMEWDDARIARALAITRPTLRKHYFRELRFREEARDRVEAARIETLYRRAREGSLPAIKELGRMIEKADLSAGADAFAAPGEAKTRTKAEKLGKKAAAAIDARTAHEGTAWAGLLPH